MALSKESTKVSIISLIFHALMEYFASYHDYELVRYLFWFRCSYIGFLEVFVDIF
jgi:hypothetical protein